MRPWGQIGIWGAAKRAINTDLELILNTQNWSGCPKKWSQTGTGRWGVAEKSSQGIQGQMVPKLNQPVPAPANCTSDQTSGQCLLQAATYCISVVALLSSSSCDLSITTDDLCGTVELRAAWAHYWAAPIPQRYATGQQSRELIWLLQDLQDTPIWESAHFVCYVSLKK